MRGRSTELELEDVGAFRLRDIAGRIQVEDIGRRSMSLVTDQRTLRMRPGRPGTRELLQQQVGDRLPVVTQDPVIVLLRILPKEGRQMLPQVITAVLPEYLEEATGPVALPPCIIHFV